MLKDLFKLLFILKVMGLATMSWGWVIFWGIIAFNWAILKEIIKEYTKK